MLHTANHVNGASLWANVHLLFWLSLIPFSSGWMGENHFAKWPVILYGINLVLCALAYTLLSMNLVKLHGRQSTLAIAIGRGIKGKASIALYITGILLSLLYPLLGFLLYTIVAMIWFIPDKRIEKMI